MNLPEPSFITRDAASITVEMVTAYEAATGRTLQPAQPERLLINLYAYRENLVRIAIQEAAKQCLLTYASYPMLDYLGELVGVERLGALPAKTTFRFTLASPQMFDVTVVAGTEIQSKDGAVVFVTDYSLIIKAGDVSGDMAATATTAGVVGNGYIAGEVAELLQPIPYVGTAANVTTTSAGAEQESDDNYRERIQEAPESWTNAGSKGAYRFFTRSAHPQIIDVTVTSPSAAVVNVYPLMSYGLPSQEVLDLVEAALTDEKVRPLTDQVHAVAPTQVDFAIAAAVTLYDWADTASVLATIDIALARYQADLQKKLGKDVVLTQIIAVINGVDGVYKTELLAPLADTILSDDKWANCTGVEITVAGYVNG
jgi:phage-related baseplate assembly protein